jgi:hypothetical protein
MLLLTHPTAAAAMVAAFVARKAAKVSRLWQQQVAGGTYAQPDREDWMTIVQRATRIFYSVERMGVAEEGKGWKSIRDQSKKTNCEEVNSQ